MQMSYSAVFAHFHDQRNTGTILDAQPVSRILLQTLATSASCPVCVCVSVHGSNLLVAKLCAAMVK